MTKHIRLLTTLLFSLLFANVAMAQWETVNIRDKQYVTARSVKSFYAFKTLLPGSGRKATLENTAVKMEISANSQECIMNSVKFILSYPVVEHSGRLLVSRIDLSKLIDPVLRPSYIRGAGNFRTVILDPGHGGKDAGAVNQYGTEAGYNLIVGRLARDILKRQGYNSHHDPRERPLPLTAAAGRLCQSLQKRDICLDPLQCGRSPPGSRH